MAAPLKQGFDYFFGYPTQVAAHNYFPETLMENNRRIPMSGNSASGELNISAVRKVYSAEVIHERALAFIEKYQERPFYLQLDYNLPHVNNELHKMTGNGFEVPGESRYADRDWTIQEKDYAEMVSLMDDYVGELSQNSQPRYRAQHVDHFYVRQWPHGRQRTAVAGALRFNRRPTRDEGDDF